MEAYKIKANEDFCDHLLRVIKDNGKWGWPDEQVVFVIRGGKILGDAAALEKAKTIVSPEYFKNNFGILKENS
jgi:hypothetical protein